MHIKQAVYEINKGVIDLATGDIEANSKVGPMDFRLLDANRADSLGNNINLKNIP